MGDKAGCKDPKCQCAPQLYSLKYCAELTLSSTIISILQNDWIKWFKFYILCSKWKNEENIETKNNISSPDFMCCLLKTRITFGVGILQVSTKTKHFLETEQILLKFEDEREIICNFYLLKKYPAVHIDPNYLCNGWYLCNLFGNF